MSPKPTGWNELHLAEDPAIDLLQSLGYTYIPPEDLEPERTSFKEPILTDRLAAALKRLNAWLSDTNVTKAVKAVTQVPATSLAEANETLYTSLTYGIALEQDRGDGRKSHTVRFLDFDSSSTVSPEVRRPGFNKIKTLGGDSGCCCLKCSGKLWPETARIIPLSSGITAITSLKYVVSMTETPHVCPRQESRPLSISSDRAKSPRRQARQAIHHCHPRPARQAHRLRRHRPTPALRGSVRRAPHGALRTLHAMPTIRPDANVVSIGPALIFERLWRETGCQEVVRKLLATRHHHFDVERAVFMTVLHRLMVSGSDRSALQWRRDQVIDGAEALELQHLYRAMGWLGEALGEREPDAPSPRRVKDLIEEELFARRRDLFSALDLVFFDTTSLFFTGNGGDTLGQYGKSKDHRSDCKQMVLGMVIDGDGIPVCSEMWPGNTTDVTTLDQVAQRLQSRFGVRRVCLVADAGMISKKMMAAVEARGWFYILGARLRRTKEVRDVVLSDTGAFETRSRSLVSVPTRWCFKSRKSRSTTHRARGR